MQSTVARLWIFAFALLTCTHPAFSQDTGTSSIDQEEEGTICLPTKHVWHGSLVEIRNIERNPVPESFKKASGGGCGGYADPEELVQWHIRFGSEPSAKAALDFVDDRYGDPQKFGDKLTKNIAATGVEIAQELERAEQNANADDDVNEIAQRILQSGKWNLKLGQLYYQPWHLIRIANLYTMAAERFASPTLRDKAHSIFATYQKMSEATRLKAENDEWPDSVQKSHSGHF